MITQGKQKHHPLVILLYTSNMLPKEALQEIPRTTKFHWNSFNHEDYYGHQWAKDYIEQLDEIKDVFKSKYAFRAVRTLLKTRKEFYSMLGELKHHKKLLKLHADSIIASVEDMAQFAGLTVKQACKYYGISKDWYYNEKNKIICELSPFKKCYKKHPHQLTRDEIQVIEELVSNPSEVKYPLSTIYFRALRKKL